MLTPDHLQHRSNLSNPLIISQVGPLFPREFFSLERLQWQTTYNFHTAMTPTQPWWNDIRDISSGSGNSVIFMSSHVASRCNADTQTVLDVSTSTSDVHTRLHQCKIASTCFPRSKFHCLSLVRGLVLVIKVLNEGDRLSLWFRLTPDRLAV